MDFASPGYPVAVIARLNRAGRIEWCLPKGHREGAETLEQAAVREVREETGIQGDILEPLGSVEYWFTVDDERFHKKVFHYLLRRTDGELTVEGDPDAEAIEADWVPLAELPARLTFPNERRMAWAAQSRLGVR